jgi:hypothetical protein
MSLRQVQAVRYVAPLREGGSLPGLIEADDGALYVVKMRGAGQGPLALVAEVITGEIARALGLRVPDLVLMQFDPLFGRQERDPEIRDLLRASVGTNMGLAFLEGSTTFDPAAGDTCDAATASLIVWLDAFVLNVDRTSRNPNLLRWMKETWLIDHGASLYFHHNWPTATNKATAPFEAIAEHVLLRCTSDMEGAARLARERLSAAEIERILNLVPAEWLLNEELVGPEERRARYRDFLVRRLAESSIFEQEVRRARASVV